ncbi:MAG: carboxypeptidase regulatory-like domain-containing protein [Pyrinomonadaceae bacterium]
MFIKLRGVAFTLLFVFLLGTFAFGQEQFGEVRGTITDPQGAAVANASVTIVGNTVGFRRTVTANSDGVFNIRQVPPGKYTVTVSATGGFAEQTKEDTQVVLGVATTVNFQVSVEGATAVVNVTDDLGVPVDTSESKVQTSVTAAKMELLPTGNSFSSVIKTAPGARGESKSGGYSIDGASGSENSFVIDGQEVSNFRTGTLNSNNNISTEFVQEVQIKSSGFEAQYGGATGGVINVVTRGGTNEFHGAGAIQFQDPRLNGKARPSLLNFTTGVLGSGTAGTYKQNVETFTSPKSQGSDFFPTLKLSGPIAKDKLWFYTAYTPQYYSSDVTTNFYNSAPAATRVYRFSERYQATTTYESAFARLDASPFESLRLSGTYLWNPQVSDGVIPFGTSSFGGSPASVNFGGTIGTLTGANLYSRQGGRQSSNNVTAQANWTPTSYLSISGRYSRGFLNEKNGNYFVPTGTRYLCYAGDLTNPNACPQGLYDPSNSAVVKDVSIRNNMEGDATYYFTGGGSHELKGGYQRFRIFNDVDSGYITTGRIDTWYNGTTIADLGSLATPNPNAIGSGRLIRYGAFGAAENTNQSLYVQDKWQIARRLTMNLGVRFEKEDLPSFNNYAPPINFGWGDKVAPRVGASFDVFGDGSTKIFGSYGKFYDRLKFELPRGSFGGNFYRVDFFDILPGDGPTRTAYTLASILGNFDDAPGGECPTTGFIGSGLSRCQYDYRIASNNPNATVEDGLVDPDLKPFSSNEFTIGFERNLTELYVFRSRYTHKNVLNAIEDAGVQNAAGSEAYIIGNPGSGMHLRALTEFGYLRSTTPQRRYDGVDVSIERSLKNNYYFNGNYTWSRLYGNYSGLASSDENGRTSPGVNRFFDLPFLGFTASGQKDNGLLATDRTHVFNAYGGYIFDWMGSKSNSTDLSFYTTVQSGTPQTSTIGWVTTVIFDKRGDLGRTPTFSQTDFAVTHKYRFGRDNKYVFSADLSIFNLFDEMNVTSVSTSYSNVTMNQATFGLGIVEGVNAFTAGQLFDQIKTYLNNSNYPNRINSAYGMADGWQGARSVRFGLRFSF